VERAAQKARREAKAKAKKEACKREKKEKIVGVSPTTLKQGASGRCSFIGGC